MDKHSSLLRALINYGRKKFYTIGLSSPKKNISFTLISMVTGINTFKVVIYSLAQYADVAVFIFVYQAILSFYLHKNVTYNCKTF
jgi:hypothetical protein